MKSIIITKVEFEKNFRIIVYNKILSKYLSNNSIFTTIVNLIIHIKRGISLKIEFKCFISVQEQY